MILVFFSKFTDGSPYKLLLQYNKFSHFTQPVERLRKHEMMKQISASSHSQKHANIVYCEGSMAKPLSPRPHPAERELWVLGTIVAVALFVGLLIYFKFQGPDQAANANRQLPALTTPDAYTDFYGTVTARDQDTLTVAMKIQRANGQQITKIYTVKTNPETIIQQRQAGQELAPSDLAAIPINAVIQVFGTEDLAPLTTFTATRITFEISS